MKLNKFQLKNDLKIITVESHKSPVVSVQMWVRTGSADEGRGEEGISHFIEHLVFKGTEKYTVGEIASIVEGSGGELNAYTSFDQTVFYVTISKEYLHTALDVISQMMGHPTFDLEEIDNEREVVIEEIKRSEDSLHRQASRKLFEGAFRSHPYGIPVIGYADNIKKFTREQIVDYYNRRYTPENMTLLVVGDFDGKEIRRQVGQYFSRAKKYKTKRAARKSEPAQKRARFQFVEGPFEETLMHLAWKIPPVTHKDIPALDALAMIMGQGDSSRLMKALRIQKHLTNYCGASTFTPKDPGFFAISSSLLPEKTEEAFSELNNQLALILNEPPNNEELEKIKTNIECDELYSIETVDGLSRKFGTYNDLFRDPEYHKKWLKSVQGLTSGDITRVARKYLKPDQLNAIILSKKKTPKIEQDYKSFYKSYRSHFKGVKLRTKKEKFSKRTSAPRWKPKEKPKQSGVVNLSSGADFIYYTNSDSPVVSVKMVWLGGQRAEPVGGSGITELISRSWVSDCEGLDEQTLHSQIDKMASHIGAFGGRNTLGLGLTSLTSFIDPCFDILDKIVTTAKFSDNVLNRETSQMMEEFKNRADNPAQVCMRQFSSVMFKDHPYSYDPLGSKKSLENIRSGNIKSHLSKLSGSKNLSVVVVGDIDHKDWIEKLENFTDKLGKGEKFEKNFNLKYPEKEEKVFTMSKKEQTHIVVGFPGLRFVDQDRFALQIIQSLLAGQGGRLFLELRDKESLAYTVSPLRMDGIDAGYVGAYIACSPEKAKKAIDMLYIEFEKLCEKKVEAEELDRAKRYLIGRHDIDLQKNSSIGSSMIFDHVYGLLHNETFLFADRISAVNPEAVQRLARQIFSQKSVISVVGSLCPW